MKVIITGGAGMIGSRLTRLLLEKNFEVVVVDNLSRGKLQYLEKIPLFAKEAFYNIDLSQEKNNDYLVHIFSTADAVVHLADVVAGIDYVFSNQYFVYVQNNKINHNVFDACAEANVKKIVYAGTACSFPREKQQGVSSVLTELDLFPANPESAYGWSKLNGILELDYLREKVNSECITLLLHNVYGPNCDLNERTSQVIPALVKKVLTNDELIVWGTGNQGRSFVFVEDIAYAFYLALIKEKLPSIIQIGTEICYTIKEIAEELVRISGRDIAIKYDTTKPEGDKGRCANIALARKALGWYPHVDIARGLIQTFDWIKRQESGK